MQKKFHMIFSVLLFFSICCNNAYATTPTKPREIKVALLDTPYNEMPLDLSLLTEYQNAYLAGAETAVHVSKKYNLDIKYKPFFYEGLGRRKDYFCDMKKVVSAINRIEKSYQPNCYTGAGYSIGFDLKFDKARQFQLLSFIDKEYQRFALEGIRLGMRDR